MHYFDAILAILGFLISPLMTGLYFLALVVFVCAWAYSLFDTFERYRPYGWKAAGIITVPIVLALLFINHIVFIVAHTHPLYWVAV